jgi:hypothetical protein
MKNENNLQTSQSKLETLKQSISKSVVIACQRCDDASLDLESTANDISVEFKGKLKENDVIKAIRNGSMGKYGVNYKLTTQIISSWIYKYLKQNSY